MAISPEAALGDKPQKLKEEVAAYEKRIDAYLKEHFNGSNTLYFEIPEELTLWVQKELIKIYEKEGWNVSPSRDKTDYYNHGGETKHYLVFTTKNPIYP